ncbi:MAG TPA: SDR family oxidoreductase [Edaphocola sp.]|nr:SDR family oxidoreductase [Edaphocola sp.]
MNLKNKVVAITGASSGIGKALALDALKRGAKVAVCARNLDKLKQIYSTYPEILLVQADIAQKEDCYTFIATIEKKWNRIDVLINNAGTSMRALFEDLDVKVLEELMAVNFWGTVYTTKAALPSIIKNKGTIVGISSIAGYRGLPGRTGYSASKFAMQGFFEALRTELLYKSVNIMWVAPGFTSSNIRNTALSADGNTQKETPLDESKLMSAEECANNILNGIEQRKRTIVMTSQGKLTVLLNKIFPKLMDKIVFNHFAKEPNSPIKKP